MKEVEEHTWHDFGQKYKVHEIQEMEGSSAFCGKPQYHERRKDSASSGQLFPALRRRGNLARLSEMSGCGGELDVRFLRASFLLQLDECLAVSFSEEGWVL
ncbi:hypothetical protein E2C01_014277 [Portunus trituberculatus]|uniref:Uncharacterized protein n=1 Tax=Portunus trituberculatus TaxID=210409 RepID=A0A5B7DJH2_PORTR|nr:hypothetical protein [Portunus trituberculatus]